jgi:hypothetical protein
MLKPTVISELLRELPTLLKFTPLLNPNSIVPLVFCAKANRDIQNKNYNKTLFVHLLF